MPAIYIADSFRLFNLQPTSQSAIPKADRFFRRRKSKSRSSSDFDARLFLESLGQLRLFADDQKNQEA